jgi:hypothetical protein
MKFPVPKPSCVHADGRTNRHDEANSLFSQFCERALNQNNGVHNASSVAAYCVLNFVYSLRLYQIPKICVR